MTTPERFVSHEHSEILRWAELQPSAVTDEWISLVEVHQYRNGLNRKEAEIRAYEELTGL